MSDIINAAMYIGIDDRGSLIAANAVPFDIKRFYILKNNANTSMLRAWHCHLIEEKALCILRGSVLVQSFPYNRDTRRNLELGLLVPQITRTVLSDKKPSLLHIPAGNAHGWMSLTDDAELLVFSSTMIQDAAKDDDRLPWDCIGGVWKLNPR